MERIGFVGLGVMGAPMAHCLLKRGFTVLAHDLRSEAVDQAMRQGAVTARDLRDLIDCDAILVMVNTDPQARSVIGRLISLLADQPRPIVSMSTILPSTIRELGAKAADAGIGVLDAPVSGGPIVAQAGRLAIMVGGDPMLFERARPVFEAMGNAIRHVGPLGAGLTLKLLNNMIAISTLPLVGEALRIGLTQGLELSTMIDVIKASSGNTWLTQEWEQVQQFLEFALRDPSQLEALVETGLKDMQLAAAFCEGAGVDAPLLAHAIGALEQHGAAELRSNLEALCQARRREQGD